MVPSWDCFDRIDRDLAACRAGLDAIADAVQAARRSADAQGVHLPCNAPVTTPGNGTGIPTVIEQTILLPADVEAVMDRVAVVGPGFED